MVYFAATLSFSCYRQCCYAVVLNQMPKKYSEASHECIDVRTSTAFMSSACSRSSTGAAAAVCTDSWDFSGFYWP